MSIARVVSRLDLGERTRLFLSNGRKGLVTAWCTLCWLFRVVLKRAGIIYTRHQALEAQTGGRQLLWWLLLVPAVLLVCTGHISAAITVVTVGVGILVSVSALAWLAATLAVLELLCRIAWRRRFGR